MTFLIIMGQLSLPSLQASEFSHGQQPIAGLQRTAPASHPCADQLSLLSQKFSGGVSTGSVSQKPNKPSCICSNQGKSRAVRHLSFSTGRIVGTSPMPQPCPLLLALHTIWQRSLAHDQ
ncbi:MAG: hypothetical protein P8Y71_20080 [Pseudolabrys sp.]